MLELGETVILLHGLARSSRSLLGLELDLRGSGYATHAIDYPSTRLPIAALAGAIARDLATEEIWNDSSRVHFVTHSMGGIVLRQLIGRVLMPEELGAIGLVVMLAPPNQGSEVADLTSRWPLSRMIMGPALEELAVSRKQAIPAWKPDIPLGIIAGTAGSAYPLGQLCLPKPHDGRVSVDATRLQGMRDHLVLPASHSLMMRRPDVRRQVLHFLETGWFLRSAATPGAGRGRP